MIFLPSLWANAVKHPCLDLMAVTFLRLTIIAWSQLDRVTQSSRLCIHIKRPHQVDCVSKSSDPIDASLFASSAQHCPSLASLFLPLPSLSFPPDSSLLRHSLHLLRQCPLRLLGSLLSGLQRWLSTTDMPLPSCQSFLPLFILI